MMRAHTSARTYVIVWVALIALTLASFLLSRLPLRELELVPALLIATAKSTLVALFFMHLLESRFTNAAALIVAVCILIVLVAVMSLDIASRLTFPPAPVSERSIHGRAAEIPDRLDEQIDAEGLLDEARRPNTAL